MISELRSLNSLMDLSGRSVCEKESGRTASISLYPWRTSTETSENHRELRTSRHYLHSLSDTFESFIIILLRPLCMSHHVRAHTEHRRHAHTHNAEAIGTSGGTVVREIQLPHWLSAGGWGGDLPSSVSMCVPFITFHLWENCCLWLVFYWSDVVVGCFPEQSDHKWSANNFILTARGIKQ